MKISLKILAALVLLGIPLSSSAGEWNEFKGDHFIIYSKDAPLDFVKSVESAAEQYYVEITENLGFTRNKTWSWDDRAKIYIYSDADDYKSNSQQMKWSHGAAFARTKTIRTFPSAHGFFDSTLPHEMGHIIFREFIGYQAVIPTWLEEGVAMYQEKAKRWGASKDVQAAIANKKFMTLMQMSQLRLSSDSPQEEVELFYAESASAVYFLISEMGEYRFVNFCKRLKDGETFEDAFSGAYVRFHKIDDFDKLWEESLKK